MGQVLHRSATTTMLRRSDGPSKNAAGKGTQRRVSYVARAAAPTYTT